MMERYFKPYVEAPMIPAGDGDYVLYDDAQAALTAKDNEITKFKFLCSQEHRDAVRLQAQRDEYREQLAAKEEELARVKATLLNHWVTAVECNHEDKTDTVRCSCSVWTGTPQPSIGKAIEQWAQHVMEQQ